jgi:hypothetical protein
MRSLPVALAVSCVAGSAAFAGAPVPTGGERRVAALLTEAHRLEAEDQPVAAYLTLREAERLTQLMTRNTADEDAPSARAMERLTDALVTRQNAALLRILHSPRVPLAAKLGLIHRLEGQVILEHPEPETLELP